MVIIKNAIENIKTNKLRVIVAMVWIVLGITSVVVVSSIGNGIEKVGDKNLDDPKFREISIRFDQNYESSIDPSLINPFTSEDLDKISLVSGVERVVAKYGSAESLSYGTLIGYKDESTFSEIIEYKDKLKLDVECGRLFSLEDLDRNVIVLDDLIAFKLFGEDVKSAIGQPVNINGEIFEVIGVLKESKENKSEMDDLFEQPKSYLSPKTLSELNNMQSFGSVISGVNILVSKGYDVMEIGDNIVSMLQTNTTEDGEYVLTDGNNQMHELGYMQQTINKFTSVISKVSLFIGGIGIMNIMYMSVTERQREIGIRRAIGAEPKDILIQFLIETIVITLIGGIVGMVVGTFAANYASGYLGIKAIPTIEIYFNAVFISVLIGAIFGSIPAYKASNLDPIKAIQG